MADLSDALVEWVEGERVPLSRYRLVEEITKFARHSRAWPSATPRQWGEAVDSAIKHGLLAERDGAIVVVVAATEPSASQLELF